MKPLKIWLPAIRSHTGADVFTQRLAEALPRYGVDAEITWFPRYREVFLPTLRAMKVPGGTDVIHCNAGFAWAVVRLGLPTLVTLHSYTELAEFDKRKPLLTRLYHAFMVRPRLRKAARLASALTAVSDAVAERESRALGCTTAATICNWVDPVQFSPLENDNAWEGSSAVLFLGRNHWAKGADLLPELAARLALHGVTLRCALAGNDWPGASVPANVELLGRLQHAQLLRELRRTRALVMPSRCEGFPLAALEAMACAKPVFGFRGTGLDMAVDDGVNGKVVEMENVEALANAISGSILDEQKMKAMGNAGRHCVLTRFTEEIAIKGYIECYRRISAN